MIGGASVEADEASRQRPGAAVSERAIEPLADVAAAQLVGLEERLQLVHVTLEEAIAPISGRAALPLVDGADVPIPHHMPQHALLQIRAPLAEGSLVDRRPGHAMRQHVVIGSFGGLGVELVQKEVGDI